LIRIETIGNATLYLGDCREILPTLGDFDAIVTDPPYGLGYDYGAQHQPRKAKDKSGARWGREWGQMIGDTKFDPSPFLYRPAVIWGANHFCDNLPAQRTWLVWDKDVPEGMNSSACELAWTSLKGGGVRRLKILWSGFRRGVEVGEHYHPTQKPVPLMAWCIEQISSTAQIILDPFMGSGPTGVAANKLGHKFIGIEIEPKYFDTACRRIEAAQRQGEMFYNQQSN